jgi:purine-binding chemotaxis protein CheW
MIASSHLSARAVELRSAFDRSFANPVRADASVWHDLLAVRIGTEPYAIRLSDVSGLFADKTVTHVPGGGTALLGLAGFRSAIVPVFSLRTLFGHAGTQAPRWLVIVAAASAALAFEAFEGHLRVAPDAILPRHGHDEKSSYAREFVRAPQFVRPVLNLSAVLDAGAGANNTQNRDNEE